jgi:23S rRNA (guanosine2251-2'-O)-methyltransferase
VYYKTDLTGPLAVIMGSEEDGISHEYLKRCDVKVQIPMQGTVGSLNVSVATGIVLFEINRQRHV